MTDEEIVEAFTAKHGITIMPGPFRQQHADLVRMAREEERRQIVAWLRREQAAMPCQSDSAVEQMGLTADAIEENQHD